MNRHWQLYDHGASEVFVPLQASFFYRRCWRSVYAMWDKAGCSFGYIFYQVKYFIQFVLLGTDMNGAAFHFKFKQSGLFYDV